MIFDSANLLAGSFNAQGGISGQLVTALGATNGSASLDLASLPGNQISDFGRGQELEITLTVLQTLTSAGAATVQVQAVQADDAAITSNVQVLFQTDAVPYTSLTAGTKIAIDLARVPAYTPKRYVSLRFVVGTAVLTNGTGQFFGGLVPSENDASRQFKGGFIVA